MSVLRIILIIVGVAFIVGVYLYTRRHPPRRDARREERIEPTFTRPEAPDAAGPSVTAPERADIRPDPATAEPPPSHPTEPEPEPEPERPKRPAAGTGRTQAPGRGSIFSLALRLPGEGVPSASLLRMLERLEFTPGERHVYHRLGPDGEPLFTAANLFEPGVLHPLPEDAMLRGLVFFFQAPPGGEASGRFDRMLGAARECAERFGGRVEDSSHRPLTAARELELKLSAAGARNSS